MLTKRMSRVVATAALAILAAAARGDGFSVSIGFSNAHLRELLFGCSASATDKYDRGVDDFAPPPGINTGYIGFFPAQKLPLLYKDIRGLAGPHEWKLLVRVQEGKPVSLSWDPKALPQDWSFAVTHGEKTLNMHKTATLAVKESATLTLRAEKRNQDTTAAGAEPSAPEK